MVSKSLTSQTNAKKKSKIKHWYIFRPHRTNINGSFILFFPNKEAASSINNWLMSDITIFKTG